MKTPVTVLGLGAMGSALAQALTAAGHPTTVWNRTPGRAPELTDVTRAKTVADAVSASSLIVVCLLDDASVQEALAPAATEFAGRTLVNLTNGTPAHARRTADWATQQSADYLDGGIMAVPEMIGGPGASILYSGSEDALEAHREALSTLARPQFVGTDPGLAALHDLALLSGMYGMFSGAVQALALTSSEKVSPTAFAEELLVPWLTAMLGSIPQIAKDLEYGAQGPAGSNLAMQSAGYVNLLDASRDQGVDPALLVPMGELLARAVREGHGDGDTAAVVQLLRTAG
ncbi:NAD(P)-dependent oxidoreductase [Kribbella sp. DT2]|uniref:NAD(P)-dependent oxidoreductase n=1 Tax=Kribbella sp. DT2 TaxID=3393427 RepID=UPI003CF3E551